MKEKKSNERLKGIARHYEQAKHHHNIGEINKINDTS